MKLRLGGSVSSLFTGERKSCSICKAISINPNFTSLFHAKSNRFLVQGFRNLQRWVHISSNVEDDFSELGPPVTQRVGTMLKLATEKPEAFMKKDPARKATACRSSQAEMIPSVKDLLLNLDKGCHACPKPENHNNISRSTGNNKPDSNFKNSCSISIENVPSIVNMSQLLQVVSSFGKISSASMRTVPDGLDCCDVKFKDKESSWRAVLAGKITIKNFHLPIRPLYVPKSIIIRIKDISKDTAYTAIHSVCKTIGEVEGMARAREDAVDVFFSLKDHSEAQNILTGLNKTIIDDCQWSAHILSNTSIPSAMSKSELPELGLQVSSRLNELKREFALKRIYSEDLEQMHQAIMHLEEQHTINNASESN